MKLTIIPDVHGRPFWRDAVKDVEDTPVIFLGDYLDPYPQDMVTWEDALQGLHDIIELKKRNPEQVTLLLGNHDVHYFESYPFFSRGGRMNHEHFEEIRDIFMENLALFDLAKCISCDNGLPASSPRPRSPPSSSATIRSCTGMPASARMSAGLRRDLRIILIPRFMTQMLRSLT